MTLAAVIGSILGGVILVGGAYKALPSFWSFVKAAAKVPTMVESMVAEFSPNGGGSLRDAVDRQSVALAGVLAWQDAHAADDVKRLAELAEHDVEMSEYLHRRMHDVLNSITPVVAWAPLHDQRLDRIEKHLRLQAEGEEVSAADLAEAKAAIKSVADDLAGGSVLPHPEAPNP